MPRPDVLAVPVGTVAHSRDRGLGRAEQARHLCVRQFGMVAYQPGDAVGLVLTLGDRGVARTLGAGGGAWHVQAGDAPARRRVLLAALDLHVGQLALRPGAAADAPDRTLPVRDRKSAG